MASIVKNLEIEEELFDSHLDLYVIFGRAVDYTPRPFSVAWMPRDKNDLYSEHKFRSEKQAKKFFIKAASGQIEPDEHKALEDIQRDQLYAWENSFISPFAKRLDEKAIHALVRRVAKEHNIRKPKVIFLDDGEDSYYDDEIHAIALGTKDDIYTLHEMAHAIHEEQCIAEDDRSHIPHPSRFTWILIDLYRQYKGFDNQYLTITAGQAGILGDMDAAHKGPRFS